MGSTNDETGAGQGAVDEDSAAPPTIWMAQVHEGVPPVPVRYEGAIALGNMVVHLTKAEVRREQAAIAP